MPKSLNFMTDEDLKSRIHRWHGSLQNNRGDRAELAQARSIDEVYDCAAFYRLKKLLLDGDFKIYDQALARTAGVLAQIRRDRDGERFGILLSQKVDFDHVKMVEKINNPDRLYREFRTFISYLKAEAPVVGVADTVYWWEVRKPNREFFFDFFMKEGA